MERLVAEMCSPASPVTALRCNRSASLWDLVFLPAARRQMNACDACGRRGFNMQLRKCETVCLLTSVRLMIFRNRLSYLFRDAHGQ